MLTVESRALNRAHARLAAPILAFAAVFGLADDAPAATIDAPAASSSPAALWSARDTFGDIQLHWRDDAGAAARYRVEIFSADGSSAKRIEFVDGATYDYPVEKSVPDYGAAPTHPVFRVTRCNQDGTPVGAPSAVYSGGAVLDHRFVKRLIVFSGDSNSAAHFMNLSGATQDRWSATAFRERYAAQFGLRPIEVMPLSAAWGSATIDKAAADGYPARATNYYWDIDRGSPGPRALQVISAVRATGLAPAAMVWIQDTDIQGFDEPSIKPMPTVTRFHAGLLATFAYFRTQLGLPALPIYISPTAGAYSGNPPLPYGVGAFDQLRATEALVASAQAGMTFLATEPPAKSVADFIPEPPPNQNEYAHYKAATYYRVALALADAMRLKTNLAAPGQPYDPATLPVSPVMQRVVVDGDSAIHIRWADALGRTLTGARYRVSIVSTDMGSAESVVRALGSFAGNEAIYSAAQSNVDYGYAPDYLGVRLVQVINGKTSVPNDWNGSVGSLGTPPTGLGARKLANGDIVYRWTADAHTTYRVTSFNVNDNSVAHRWFVTGQGQQRYTEAQILADYGYDTNNYYFAVSAIDAATGVPAAAATLSGTAP